MTILLNMDIQNVVSMVLVGCVPAKSVEGSSLCLPLLQHEHSRSLLLFRKSISIPRFNSRLDLRPSVHHVRVRSLRMPTTASFLLQLNRSHSFIHLRLLILVDGCQYVPDEFLPVVEGFCVRLSRFLVDGLCLHCMYMNLI